MLQLIPGLFVLLSQIQNEQLLHFQLLSCLSYFRSGSGGLPGHGFPDPSRILDFLLDIIDHPFQIGQVALHLLDLRLNFLLLALVVGSLVFDGGSAVHDDDRVLFDLFLLGFLLAHF